MLAFNLLKKMELIQGYWNPHILAELNQQQVRLVKIQGEFVWHQHELEDEFFLVLKGQFEMHFRDKIITLKEMDAIVVPRKTEHKPVAHQECWILLFEPADTLNTGNVQDALTKTNLPLI